ncbi:MAG TPA: cardiolipin synthase [Opitutaceae bacterium]|nr:cardiolipin synthase [Opitutaceae bacterium]
MSQLEKIDLRRNSSRSADAKKPPRPRDPESRRWWLVAAVLVVLVALYFWFTSAKILGEPIEFAYGAEDPAFAETIGPLLGVELVDGNSVETLVNGDAFFPVMLDAIRAAKKSVTMETYIWTSGKISNQFMEVLSERARHGVKVHVLADGMGTLKLKDSDIDLMKAAGVEFFSYGREHWYDFKANINHRTHRKLLMIDGLVGFTGGMCVDDLWLGNADDPKHWRETVVRVEGPAVRQMQSVFATNWLQTTQRLLVGPDYFPKAVKGGSALVQCFKSGPQEDPENARIAYLLAIASARKSIRIAHAYFVPDDLAVGMLLAARRRGVEIEVIIPAINDSRFGRAASRSRWGKLLEAGVKFHQYLPAMYHCKVMIVDDVFVTVGSTNFDNRSFRINDEVNVNVLDRRVAAQHLKVFADDLAKSKPLTRTEFEGRPTWQKAVDHFCGMFRSQL